MALLGKAHYSYFLRICLLTTQLTYPNSGEVSAIIESQNADSVIVLGDFNMHPGSLFYTELYDFRVEQTRRCAYLECPGSDS